MQQQQSLARRIWQSAIVKIIVGFVTCAFTIGIGQTLVPKMVGAITKNVSVSVIVTGILVSAAVIIVYKALFRAYEKRHITELSVRHIFMYSGAGILLGTIYQALVILVIYMSGGYTIETVNMAPNVLPYFMISVSAGITEEIIFRGIIFRLAEEKLGSYIALLISAVIFGAVHLMNDNSTPLAATAIAVEAGLLLGTAYMYTRNLWFPIAIHFAWNFAQSGIFGASTSGFAFKDGFITAKIQGNTLITGGMFGPEATVQAMALGLLASIILLTLSIRKGNLKAPYWKKTLQS